MPRRETQERSPAEPEAPHRYPGTQEMPEPQIRTMGGPARERPLQDQDRQSRFMFPHQAQGLGEFHRMGPLKSLAALACPETAP